MTTPDRRTVLAFLGATGLTACAQQIDIADSKKTPKGGIGGTGIVGTLTDFGSLIVNGSRIVLDGKTQVLDAFGQVDRSTLAIGQALTIEAAGAPDRLLARTVRITHPVIGTVSRADADGRNGVVAGVSVASESGAIGQMKTGTRVAVSGIWRGGAVVASRIDPLSKAGPSVIAGVLESLEAEGGRIAGVKIKAPLPRLPGPGSFMTVAGRFSGNTLVTDQIAPGRFFNAAGPLRQLSIEGFLESDAKAPFYAVSGLGHSFDAAARLNEVAGKRAVFGGEYSGAFVVRQALILPQDLRSRRELSAGIASGALTPETVPTR